MYNINNNRGNSVKLMFMGSEHGINGRKYAFSVAAAEHMPT